MEIAQDLAASKTPRRPAIISTSLCAFVRRIRNAVLLRVGPAHVLNWQKTVEPVMVTVALYRIRRVVPTQMWKSACVQRICSVATFSGIPTAQITQRIHAWDAVGTGNVPKVKTARPVHLTVHVMTRPIVLPVFARAFVEMGSARWARIALLALWIVGPVRAVVVLPMRHQGATPFW